MGRILLTPHPRADRIMGKLTVKQLESESVTKQDVGCKLFDGDGLYGRVRSQERRARRYL